MRASAGIAPCRMLLWSGVVIGKHDTETAWALP